MSNKIKRYDCWVCGKSFAAKRCTAFMCSARCRQWRSRFYRSEGRFPRYMLGEVAPWHIKHQQQVQRHQQTAKGASS